MMNIIVLLCKTNDAGRQIEVEFGCSTSISTIVEITVYGTLKWFKSHLKLIYKTILFFLCSGYTCCLETTVGSIRKENFGNKSLTVALTILSKPLVLNFPCAGMSSVS